MEKFTTNHPIEPEDKERVNMIAQHIVAPALDRAIEHALTKAPINEVVSATANAYAAVLIEMVGRSPAIKLMAAHVSHLEKIEENFEKNDE